MNFKITLALPAIVTLLCASQAQSACTAGNPNDNVVEATPIYDSLTAPYGLESHTDGTATHHLTGLMWSRCSVGQVWDGTSCTGTPAKMTWPAALASAVTANASNYHGYNDWRLPNLHELLSIVETCGHANAINETVFSIGTGLYWSADNSAAFATEAWIVNFIFGSKYLLDKTTSASYVLLVRGGHPLDAFDALAPRLSGEHVTGAVLYATSHIDATGYWLVVPQGSTAPTPTQVQTGADYGTVTVAAAGIGSMSGGTEAAFALSGLAELTNYDVYLVGYNVTDNALSHEPIKVSFSTLEAPDAFAFTDQFDVAMSTLATSDTITVSGLTATAQISVTGGEYSINGGTWTSAAGTVNNGDTVTVHHTSSARGNTTTDTVLIIGGGSDTFSSTTVHDFTPDAFTFTDQSNVAQSSSITSDTITVSGISTGVEISITGGEYSINGSAYTSAAGTVNEGDEVTVRHTSAASDLTQTDTVLTIGGVSDTFSSTTGDATPDAFTFIDQVDVALNTLTTSSITVSGITLGVEVSVTGGEYRINGGAWITTAGTVNNGDTVTVRHTSSATELTKTDTVLTIGGVNDTFSSTTADFTPDAFSFTDKTQVALDILISSEPITVSGITAAVEISVTGGEYSINGGTWTSAAGTVNNSDSVTVRHTSSASELTKTDTVLTIGGVSDTFSTTTGDATPDAFSFTDLSGVAFDAFITSSPITVSGITAPTPISVENGEYAVNGGAFTSAAGMVNNGDSVTVRHTSAASPLTTTETTLTIGGVSDTFSATTGHDLIPDTFTFTDEYDVAMSTLVTTSPITVSGITAPSPISVGNGEYAINDGAFTSEAGMVSNGDTVTVRHTSSANGNSTTDTILSIGGVADTFSSTTEHDVIPNAFSFTYQRDVALNAYITSDTITVSGISTDVAISVTGGEYSINGGAWTSAVGTIGNGDEVTVRHMSAADTDTTTSTALTIGGISASFNSTTEDADDPLSVLSLAGNNNGGGGAFGIWSLFALFGLGAIRRRRR